MAINFSKLMKKRGAAPSAGVAPGVMPMQPEMEPPGVAGMEALMSKPAPKRKPKAKRKGGKGY